jgi:hypothetical protein
MSERVQCSSWVIRERETGVVICETYNRLTLDRLNHEKYEAVHIMEYLCGLNKQIKAAAPSISSPAKEGGM